MLNIRAKRNRELPEEGIALFIFDHNGDAGETRRARLTLDEVQNDGIAVDPLTVMPEADAQRLFDDLWAAGLRPTADLGDVSGVLTAKNSHLSDLMEIIRCLLPDKTSQQ